MKELKTRLSHSEAELVEQINQVQFRGETMNISLAKYSWQDGRDTSSGPGDQDRKFQFVKSSLHHLLSTAGLGVITFSSLLPSNYRLDLHTWRLEPGTRVTATVTPVDGQEIDESVFSQLSVTVTMEDVEVTVVRKEMEGSVLMVHFTPSMVGKYTVAVCLNRLHILGSPLIIPVVEQPHLLLQCLGLRPNQQEEHSVKETVQLDTEVKEETGEDLNEGDSLDVFTECNTEDISEGSGLNKQVNEDIDNAEDDEEMDELCDSWTEGDQCLVGWGEETIVWEEALVGQRLGEDKYRIVLMETGMETVVKKDRMVRGTEGY